MSEFHLYDLRHHPKYAEKVGNIAAAWNAVEQELCSLFTFVTSASPWQARRAFYAVTGSYARIQLIKSTVSAPRHDSKWQQRLMDKLELANKASEMRNKYVHKPYGIDWSDPVGAAETQVFMIENIGREFPLGQKRAIQLDELEKAHGYMRKTVVELTILTSEYSKEFPLTVPSYDLGEPVPYKFE